MQIDNTTKSDIYFKTFPCGRPGAFLMFSKIRFDLIPKSKINYFLLGNEMTNKLEFMFKANNSIFMKTSIRMSNLNIMKNISPIINDKSGL